MSTGRYWVETPIPVFQHGAPTACHPTPVGMIPGGYWRDSGYWTGEKTWAPGRPVAESGCDACAEVVKAAAGARNKAREAARRSAAALGAVVEAAGADLDAPLDRLIDRYADLEAHRARRESRADDLAALVAAQDRRAKGVEPSGTAGGATRTGLSSRSDADAQLRERAAADAVRAAERERTHLRAVRANAARYGAASALREEHGTLRRYCQRRWVELHPFVLLVCVVGCVAAAVVLERRGDWVPDVLDAVRYSEEVRAALSVPLGAAAGCVLFGLLWAVYARLHRRRVAVRHGRARMLRERVGCGDESCARCERPEPFVATSRVRWPEVGRYVVVGGLAVAMYAAVAALGPFVSLQRLSAAVPAPIRDDCRHRESDGGPVELICRGPGVREIGLRRVYFQVGVPERGAKGIFEQARVFRHCRRLPTRTGIQGSLARCGPRSAAWADEERVIGGAVGRRALKFARLQYLHRGERPRG
ncbi:MAG: hypothetical protein GXY03_13790 [Solirubrobacterales bacterium]|nr:hypothetical protein [Solirubrobacterales bacterium]